MNAFDYDKIDRYLEGEMSSEEMQAFEMELQKDSELKKEVELYRDVHQSLQNQLHPNEDEKSLRSTLRDLRGEFFAKTGSTEKDAAKVVPMSRSKRWLAIAASLLVLLAASILLWNPLKKDLYEQYAFVKMPAVTERGDPADSLLKLATFDFNEKEYVQSINRFESLLQVDTGNAYARYYYGIALLHEDKTENARSEFNRIYNGSSAFKYDAAFFMALSFLKEKQNSTARQWLQRIPPGTSGYERAQKLLKEL